MRKGNWIVFVVILSSFIIAVYLYPQMPGRMASHWNVRGEVDGYLPKFWALFLMPSLSAGLVLLFIVLPRIDPLKNIEKFGRYYDGFLVVLTGFLFYLYLLTIFWNIGFRFSLIQLLTPAFGMLFYYIGVLTEKAKRNWFVGIRTPWTLSNEGVWEKTHKLGGKLFKLTGIIAFFGTVLEGFALFFVLAPVLIVSIYVVVYSYFEYQKIEIDDKLDNHQAVASN